MSRERFEGKRGADQIIYQFDAQKDSAVKPAAEKASPKPPAQNEITYEHPKYVFL